METLENLIQQYLQLPYQNRFTNREITYAEYAQKLREKTKESEMSTYE